MDKYEYKVKAEEVKTLISEGEFAEAMQVADTIDWRRVKSVMMLCTISDLYKINRKFQESKDILLLAYERHPGGRLIVYSLCELSVKMGEFVQAIEYYKEFVQIAPKDTSRYILQYKLYEAQDVSLEERIAVLEEFKKRDYREKWAYELAYLYHRVGLETKCVEECDEMALWFGEGRYIIKSLELKMLHQPLSDDQMEKYTRLKQMKEAQIMAERDEAYMPDEAEEMEEEAENTNAQEETEEYTGNVEADTDMDYHVKPVDVSQYNTINLQQELAKSMHELLSDEKQSKETHTEEEGSSMGMVTESILAPLLQETGDMETAALRAEETNRDTILPFEKKAPEQAVLMGQPQAAKEEVFFEDMKDVLLEDTKELPIENFGDTKEIRPGKRVIYPADMQPVATSIPEPEPETPAPQVSNVLQMIPKPSGFERMLAQEYDGQIKLVVPDKTLVEKQITGQMSIVEIMSEWEKMKRDNEQKRREDVRKRVQQHTGNLLSEFEEASKTGLLEQLEEAGIIPGQTISVVIPEIAEEEAKEKTDVPAASLEIKPEETHLAGEQEIKEEVAEKLLENPADNGHSDLIKEALEDVNRSRPLSEEEKELFGKFIQTKKVKEQIIHAVDTMSMDSYTDNVIVTGEAGTGTLSVAKGLIRILQISDSNFSGKVAKISGNTLNKKDVAATFAKLSDGAVIIEQATEMMQKTAEELSKALSENSRGLLVILLGSRDKMNNFLGTNHILESNFNARIDVEALNDHALVEYARQYAEDQEYSIDELGILALHTRIADMQTSDHEVTIEEVKELVDDAIYFADKKNPKHLFDILFGKRYDEEDMIILRENDFMHY